MDIDVRCSTHNCRICLHAALARNMSKWSLHKMGKKYSEYSYICGSLRSQMDIGQKRSKIAFKCYKNIFSIYNIHNIRCSYILFVTYKNTSQPTNDEISKRNKQTFEHAIILKYQTKYKRQTKPRKLIQRFYHELKLFGFLLCSKHINNNYTRLMMNYSKGCICLKEKFF